MKKQILSLALAFALALSFAPAVGPSAKAAEPGTYNPGDIAVINAIIDNNGLNWTPAPADGSDVPADWTGVTWSNDSTDKRVIGLVVSNENLSGKLDVSNLTSLTNLYCDYNQLTELDVSGLSALTELYCFNNQLTELDVSGLSALIQFSCDWNQLSTLNISANTALTKLWCTGNKLAELNISHNTALIIFWCAWNQLTELDVSANTELIKLGCNDNFLTSEDFIIGLNNTKVDKNEIDPDGESHYVFQPQRVVVFKDHDGTELAVAAGVSPVAPPPPTRPGYLFTGWALSELPQGREATAVYTDDPDYIVPGAVMLPVPPSWVNAPQQRGWITASSYGRFSIDTGLTLAQVKAAKYLVLEMNTPSVNDDIKMGVHTDNIGWFDWDATGYMSINKMMIVVDLANDADWQQYVVNDNITWLGVEIQAWNDDWLDLKKAYLTDVIPDNYERWDWPTTIFFKDHIGTVLATGDLGLTAPVAPLPPSRAGYTFTGWKMDLSFNEEGFIVRNKSTVNATATYTDNPDYIVPGAVMLPVPPSWSNRKQQQGWATTGAYGHFSIDTGLALAEVKAAKYLVLEMNTPVPNDDIKMGVIRPAPGAEYDPDWFDWGISHCISADKRMIVVDLANDQNWQEYVVNFDGGWVAFEVQAWNDDWLDLKKAYLTDVVPEGFVPGNWKTALSSAAVTVAAPATRATPVTTSPTAGTGYTCGPVIWTPTVPATGKFLGGTAYTATVTLTADDGYTFPEDFTCTINGKTAIVTYVNETTVTVAYTFPKTAPTGNGVEVTVGVETYPKVKVTITIFLAGAPIYEGTFPKN